MDRLQKVMSRAGVASRRRSEEMILRGLVSVDGQIVRELGIKVDPQASRIEVKGKPISLGTDRTYIMLNKPSGFITTVVDPYNRPTVMEFVAEHDRHLFPVGRLDMDSEGLLLLTDDGDLSYRLTHPRFKVQKEYVVVVEGRPRNESIWKLRNGLELEDGVTHPAIVRFRERVGRHTVLEIIISQGRKRQVRRMCEAIGHRVVALERTAIGPLRLGGLRQGDSRRLTSVELVDLKRLVGLG